MRLQDLLLLLLQGWNCKVPLQFRPNMAFNLCILELHYKVDLTPNVKACEVIKIYAWNLVNAKFVHKQCEILTFEV